MTVPAIKCKRLHPDAVIPEQKTDGSGGYDLTLVHGFDLPGDDFQRLGTGIAVAIPPGWGGFIVPRSSMYELMDIQGFVDSDYRGEVKVQVKNRDGILIRQGERIAQMIVVPVHTAGMIEVDELDETKRGSGGFGSTGTKNAEEEL